jgi:lauroyl/myristoyl acyltransferase
MTGSRGTRLQRARAAIVARVAALIGRIPVSVVEAATMPLGELWYRLAPARRDRARRNLGRVVRHLAARGLGGERVARAAAQPPALERLVRLAFRHAVAYYLDMVRLPRFRMADLDRLLTVETPETVEAAFGPGTPIVFVAMHFGAVEFPALYAVRRTGHRVVAPMETLGDPELQAWITRTRGSVGIDIVGLRDARRALAHALDDGRSVGLVTDRNVAGGTIDVQFFGATAPLPLGPGMFAVQAGRPIYLAAVRRAGGGRVRGRLLPVETEADGALRSRVQATMQHVAERMEEAIADAPEQWWTVFFPIWPDLDPEARVGTGRLESREDAGP